MTRVGLGALVLVSCTHGSVSRPSPPLPIPEDLRAEVDRVQRAASELVALELVTAAGSSLVKPQRHRGDPPVIGMVALRTSWARGGSAVFVTERPAGGVQVLYEARVSERWKEVGMFRRLDDPRPLVGEEEEAWNARKTTLAVFREGRCQEPLDVLVLPRSGGEDRTFDVYPLPVPKVERPAEIITVIEHGHLSSSSRGTMEFVVAGHHRFHISEDGLTVLDHTQLTPRCKTEKVEMVHPPNAMIEMESLEVDVPDEVQVFTSAVSGWGLRVTTRRGTWELLGGRLSLVALARPH